MLSETLELFADVAAAKLALQFISRLLDMKIGYSGLDRAAENNRRFLGSFAGPRAPETPSFVGPV